MGERGGGFFRARRDSIAGYMGAWARRTWRRVDPADVIGRPTEALESYRAIIDRASAQAKIGMWECDLATGALAWTEGVFALFELPDNARVTRAEAVACYQPESRAEMEAFRARAINELRGFTLDARIRTAKGNERWMRLTANVDCRDGVAVRLFGMKQDITEEKTALERLRVLAETDLLTGLANRCRFQTRLETAPPAALLLIDLDGFKRINDTFGHQAGDECLKQVATRLRAVCPPDALIARLGGDEFAVVVGAGDVEALVASLLVDLRRPAIWNGRVISMSGSIGVAVPTPPDRHNASSLLEEADIALYAAKAAGRDTSRVFVPEMRITAEARFRASETLFATDSQFDLFASSVTPAARLAA